MTTKELLTRAETAELFSISIRTLDNWNKQGILKRLKIGGIVFYRTEDIKELITFNTSANE